MADRSRAQAAPLAPTSLAASDGLDAASEEAFCRLIARRSGIVLQDHQMPNLRQTVAKGCARFAYPSPADYLAALAAAPDMTPQLEYLIAGVTVGESYFFRDSEQIKLLRTQVLPDLIARKRSSGDLSLRVWSAGCSQGQELYTIALLLQELLPDIASWRIHLLGTDISIEAIAMALRSRYSEWSFRAMPPELREHWFSRVGRDYEIKPEIRKMARFVYLNLAADVYPSILNDTNAQDLILCRNVFIYLDRQAVRRSMARFAGCLSEQGVLLLGASDPLEYGDADLELVQHPLAWYFLRKGASVPALQAVSPATQPAPQRPASAVATEVDRAALAGLLARSDWPGVLAQVEKDIGGGRDSGELWQMKARALANLGRAEPARQACLHSLVLDPLNQQAYLILGLILAELEREQEAGAALRKALYLDRSFLEAHYELGMLQVRSRQLPAGLKSLGVALKLALQGPPEQELQHAAGMTYRRFAQILQNEIALLRESAGHRPAPLRPDRS